MTPGKIVASRWRDSVKKTPRVPLRFHSVVPFTVEIGDIVNTSVWVLSLVALVGGGDAFASTALTSSRLAIGINVDGSLVTEDRSLGIRYDPGGGASDAPMG